MNEQEYRKYNALNYSKLADFYQSPDHALLPRKSKSYFEIGHAFEMALIDAVKGTDTFHSRFFNCSAPGTMPEKLSSWIENGDDLAQYIQYKQNGDRSNTYKRLHAWIDECIEQPGLMPMSMSDLTMITAMVDNMLKAKIDGVPTPDIIGAAETQKAVTWNSGGIEKKALYDLAVIGPSNHIMDIKSSANFSQFMQMLRRKYFIQAIHYQEGIEQTEGQCSDMFFMVAIKEPPYLTHIVKIHQESIVAANAIYVDLCDRYVEWDRKPVGWRDEGSVKLFFR
jgi:hypothetical protein